MPSEYDFLLPYSRAARRVGAMLLGGAAFLAGALCMTAIIALPLRTGPNDAKPAPTEAASTEPAKVADGTGPSDVKPDQPVVQTNATLVHPSIAAKKAA